MAKQKHHNAEQIIAYLVFDHAGADDTGAVKVTAHLINCMKADLSEAAFRVFVPLLAAVLAGTGDRDQLERLVHGHLKTPPAVTPQAIEDFETDAD